ILDVRGGMRTQEQSRRVSEAMLSLGWRRPNSNGTISIGGKTLMGFVKGDKPWPTITATRHYTVGLIWTVEEPRQSEDTGGDTGEDTGGDTGPSLSRPDDDLGDDLGHHLEQNPIRSEHILNF